MLINVKKILCYGLLLDGLTLSITWCFRYAMYM